MKFYNKISLTAIAALALAAGLSSCSDDDKYWDNGAPSGDGLTFDRKSMAVIYSPGEEIPSPVFNVVLRRGTTEGTETAQFTSTSPNPAGTWTVPTSATFADGANEAIIPVVLNTEEVGVYTDTLKLAGNVALGGNPTLVLKVSIQAGDPNPEWQAYGTGTYVNKWFFSGKYKVAVEKDMAEWPEGSNGYHGHYRMVKPLQTGFDADGWEEGLDYDSSVVPDYIEFFLIAPGQTFQIDDFGDLYSATWGVDPYATDAYYVYIPSYNSGVIYSGPGDFVEFITPRLFNLGIDGWLTASVLGWIDEPTEDDPQGAPGAVSMGTIYTYPSAGGYYSYARSTKDFQFIFPGFSLGDYSFELAYYGHTFNEDYSKEYIEATVAANGADCRNFVVGLVAGNNTASAEATVQAYLEARQEAIADDEDPDDVTKPASLVGYTEQRIDEGNIGNFRYEVPSETAWYTFVAISLDEDGGVAEVSSLAVKFVPVSSMLDPDADWENLGIGIFTDDLLIELYSDDPSDVPTYEVQVQQSMSDPTLIRIVDPYGKSVYPYNLSDFTPNGEGMVFNVANPQCVKMPLTYYGVVDGFSTIGFISYSEYLAASYDDNVIIANEANGIYEDGIISFPYEKSILMSLPDVNPTALYISNAFGMTELILPDAAGTAVSNVKARLAKTAKGSKAKVNGRKLRVNRQALKSQKCVNLIKTKSSSRSIKPNAPKDVKLKKAPQAWRIPMIDLY